jgi:hypothetical protein
MRSLTCPREYSDANTGLVEIMRQRWAMSDADFEEWQDRVAWALNNAINAAIDKGIDESCAFAAFVTTYPELKAAMLDIRRFTGRKQEQQPGR